MLELLHEYAPIIVQTVAILLPTIPMAIIRTVGDNKIKKEFEKFKLSNFESNALTNGISATISKLKNEVSETLKFVKTELEELKSIGNDLRELNVFEDLKESLRILEALKTDINLKNDTIEHLGKVIKDINKKLGGN